MDYRELPPHDTLRHVVRCYWFLSGDGSADGPGEPALPDGSPELIINLSDPFQAFTANGAPTVQPLTMLVGQITGPFVVGPTGHVQIVAVRFEPHGAAMFCRNMAAITNRWIDYSAFEVSARDALHVPSLRDALSHAIGQSAPFDACVEILNTRLQSPVTMSMTLDPRVTKAVRLIREFGGVVAQDAMAREIGTTPRTLQRLFASHVGISPKLLARITRFQRVFRAWQQAPHSLARVAMDCGYFDQSHLVRDFRDFAGEAPAAFLAAQPEFTAFFTSGR